MATPRVYGPKCQVEGCANLAAYVVAGYPLVCEEHNTSLKLNGRRMRTLEDIASRKAPPRQG